MVSLSDFMLFRRESEDPLFIDPYVGCFLKSSEEAAEDECSNCYGLGTRYIDDMVVDVLSRNDDVRQVFVVTVRFKEFLFCYVIGIVKDLRLKLDHINWIFWHDHCLITFMHVFDASEGCFVNRWD